MSSMEIHAPALLLEHPGEKTRILVLTTSYPNHEDDPSGVFIAKLLQAIRRRGYELTVLAPSDGTSQGRKALGGIDTVRFGYFWPRALQKLTRTGGGIPENLKKSVLAKLQLFPMMLIFLLRGLSEARQSEIIYANWLGAGMVGAALSRITGKPLVLTLRGDDGYLARDRWIWRVPAKWVMRRAAMIAPVSRELLDIIRGLGVPEAKCHLPRFGVDMEMFHPPAMERASTDRVQLLFVGSLIERKGLHDLIAALDDPVFAHVELLVVGEGVQQAHLMALGEQHGLGRIAWLGSRSPVEVAELMRSVDLFCLPSYMEGRPNVVNEAMASALPVVTTRIGGIPDMLQEGETAFLFDPGDVQALRRCLATLVTDAQLRHSMGNAGHAFLVESGVSWDSTAEEFDAIFSTLTTQRR